MDDMKDGELTIEVRQERGKQVVYVWRKGTVGPIFIGAELPDDIAHEMAVKQARSMLFKKFKEVEVDLDLSPWKKWVDGLGRPLCEFHGTAKVDGKSIRIDERIGRKTGKHAMVRILPDSPKHAPSLPPS